MIKTIKLPVELGGRAYAVELIDATSQGKGYLVRAFLAAQPTVYVESAVPFNNTAIVSQTVVTTTSSPPWGGTTVLDSEPTVTYANIVYGGNNAVVWARQDTSRLYVGIGYLKA